MTDISSPPRDSSFLSPRTRSYIAALIREGDTFNYSNWLRRVRQEETQPKPDTAMLIVNDTAAAEIGDHGRSDGIAERKAYDQSRFDFDSGSADNTSPAQEQTDKK